MDKLFTLENSNKKFLFQWDLNQRFVVNDPFVIQAHYQTSSKEEPMSCEVFEENGLFLVDVPNILLQKAGNYRVFAYYQDSTIDVMQFEVKARPKPADYIYEETELITIEKIVYDKLQEAKDSGIFDGKDGATPYIGDNGNWWIDGTDTGVTASTEELVEDIYLNIADIEGKISVQNKRITNLENHIDPQYFVTDSVVAYDKQIPSNVCPYVQIDSVGGMTYRKLAEGGNLLNPALFGRIVNADGSIAYPGGSSSFSASLTLPAGTYTITSDNVSIAVKSQPSHEETFTVAEGESVTVAIAGDFDGAEDACDVKVMLNEGDERLPFKSYYDSFELVDTKVTAVKSIGANLIPFPYVSLSGEYNGVTFTVKSDGSLTIVGTATKETYFNVVSGATLGASGACFLSGIPSGGGYSTYRMYLSNGGNTYTDIGAGRACTLVNDKVSIVIVVANGATVNTTIKPMLNYGSAAAPYKPYLDEPIETKEIPVDAIKKRVKGYGLGIGGIYYNSIYKEGNKIYYKQVCEEVVLDGTEKITSFGAGNNGGYCYRVTTTANLKNSSLAEITLLSDKYTAVQNVGSIRNMAVGSIKEYGYGNDIDIVSAKVTEEEFRQELKGTRLIYALATPIVTDITDLFTEDFDVFKVEAGGSFKFVNEHEDAVPSSITYLLKEGSI